MLTVVMSLLLACSYKAYTYYLIQRNNAVLQSRNLDWIVAAKTKIDSQRKTSPPQSSPSEKSLLALSTEEAEQLGLEFDRYKPDGSHSIQISIQEAPLESLLQWVDNLLQKYSLQVNTLTLRRTDNPGMASLSIQFFSTVASER